MMGSGALLPRTTPLPQPTIAQRQKRRKYYIMRQLSFQVISDKKGKDGSNEVKEAEQIRRSVYSIMRREQREQQPHRTQGVVL